ncbi:type I restriction enzyme M protein [Algoriphagus alkaliphilus]|uniref:site-specific DNA-methyltransferase (adenine-specific) n=1 Tax=Algoriphagus alkaliphilus TaxID=279824 RepID=A0A1G5ZMG7_9BACT|nr:class I SAM-dependent DNA methyltransferase [Algoriphagus alkaliphilus]SDA96011.1 type I restriction enzyme M protein [Algoriphagus alkaliphilus]
MQGKQLRKLETELWRAADQLRANSKLTASEYSMPVLGLIFLRHAYNRFQKVKVEVEKTLPSHPQRGKRPLTKKDFEEQNSMFLPDEAQFDYLVSLPESADIGEAIDNAMKLIEDEYDNLKGVLPKNFSIFSKDLLRELLRIFNKEVLQKAEGDLFGKIYEYFLGKFAMTGAQEGGEFFTPMSLVQTIVNVIEPDHGTVFDPACGSAGMFVQTGYFIESEGLKPAEKVTFYGQEKAELNTKLAKMNLTVHGLEGNIQEGNTFYEDKHSLVGGADFVMANPPFNVDGVDKAKDAVKKDPRLILDGKVNLPKNDNANYLWIQYFYNYLKPTGRAGFVMASSASDAGHTEKDIREKLVKTGAVDVMMAIGNNFFYTRSLPCTLWFFDRAKENDATKRDKVLMLDARKIYRKVTSKVNDFSPEQLQNLICIVNLYRGNTQKFDATVQDYLESSVAYAKETAQVLDLLQQQFEKVHEAVVNFAVKLAETDKTAQTFADTLFLEEGEAVEQMQNELISLAENATATEQILQPIALACKNLRKQQDKLIKQFLDAITQGQKELQLNKNKDWKELGLKEQLDQLKALQQQLSGNPDEEEPGLLHETEYFYKQAHWLNSRFPDGVYADVEGLCKVVNQTEIEAKDWSLSPGRYVGVDTATDEDFDYEERLNEIHIELEGLNEEAVALANSISENYKTVLI